MNKEKRITIRLTEEEYRIIEEKSKSALMNFSKYSRHALLNKHIVAVDGIRELTIELRRIGGNLNNLTRLANEGRIYAVDLDYVKRGVAQIWQSLSSLTPKVR